MDGESERIDMVLLLKTRSMLIRSAFPILFPGLMLLVFCGCGQGSAGEGGAPAGRTSRQQDAVLRVAAAQIPVTVDISANVGTICRAIDSAVTGRADILLTPEGALSGYTHEFDQRSVDEGIRTVVEKARASSLALALGTCYRENGASRPCNQVRFYDRDGRFLGAHCKILRCGSHDAPSYGEVGRYATCPLRTFQLGGVTVGGLVCNDLWANPECTPMPDAHLSQQLSKMGARVIFHAVNGGRDGSEWSDVVGRQLHEANLRLRARAGRVWIVTADNCAPTNLQCSAPSGIVAPDGSWAAKGPNRGERVVIWGIELKGRSIN